MIGNRTFAEVERELYMRDARDAIELLDVVRFEQEEIADASLQGEVRRLEREVENAEEERDDEARDAATARNAMDQVLRALAERRSMWRLLRNAPRLIELLRELRTYPNFRRERELSAEVEKILFGESS